MLKKKTLWKHKALISFRLYLYSLLRKIWGCEDRRVGSKKDDLKNVNPTFASIFLTAQTEMCLLKTKQQRGPEERAAS